MRVAMRALRAAALGSVQTVASTIQKIEGWYPPGTPGYPQGSLSYRMNNPGNLTYAGQPGATPVQVCNPNCHTFAQFDTVDDGQQALDNQIELDASRGQSIAQFASIYAPAADSNDPTSYAAQIAAASGLSVGDPLTAALDGSTPAAASTDTTGTDSTDTSGTSWLDSITGAFSSVSDSLSTMDPTTLAVGAGVAGLLLVFAFNRGD